MILGSLLSFIRNIPSCSLTKGYRAAWPQAAITLGLPNLKPLCFRPINPGFRLQGLGFNLAVSISLSVFSIWLAVPANNPRPVMQALRFQVLGCIGFRGYFDLPIRLMPFVVSDLTVTEKRQKPRAHMLKGPGKVRTSTKQVSQDRGVSLGAWGLVAQLTNRKPSSG